MAHWMPIPGTRSGVDDLETLGTLVRTFAKVFPYTYIHKSLHGIGLHVIGSMEPIVISADAIKIKLANKAVFDDLNEWDKPSLDFLTTGWMTPSPEFVANGPITTDNEPYLEFYLLRTLKSGGKKMFPSNFW